MIFWLYKVIGLRLNLFLLSFDQPQEWRMAAKQNKVISQKIVTSASNLLGSFPWKNKCNFLGIPKKGVALPQNLIFLHNLLGSFILDEWCKTASAQYHSFIVKWWKEYRP